MSQWIKKRSDWVGVNVNQARRKPGRPPREITDSMITIEFHVIRCPHCNSRDVPVVKTLGDIRYHWCQNCNETFRARWL